MEQDIKRIKGMYNACARIFNAYLSDHDMVAYNNRINELIKEYGCENDIKDLVCWFAPKVQTLHDMYMLRGGK